MKRTSLMAMALMATSTMASAETLRVVTGAQGGAWFPLGGALKAAVEARFPDLSLTILPGGGTSNVQALELGRADLGFTFNVSTVDGLKGNPPFAEPVRDVCHVATLFPSYYQIVAVQGGGVGSLDDLAGKSLTTSQRGSTTEAINRHLLSVLGLSYDDLSNTSFTSFTDSVSLMKDGNADVFIVGTSVPASAVMDLASSRDVVLLPVPGEVLAELREINPGYVAGEIPAGSYPDQDEPVETIEFATHIIARCSLDEATAYEVTRAFNEGAPDMVAVNAGLAGMGPEDFRRDVGVPLHPGAARYWAEVAG